MFTGEKIIDHLQSISLMTTGSQAARASEKEDGMIRKADGGKINRTGRRKLKKIRLSDVTSFAEESSRRMKKSIRSAKERLMENESIRKHVKEICLFSAAYFIELMQAIRCMQSLFRTVKR
ncbi:hypothetical protein D918_02267 [Trichuris suis]|nr:hypothetical protein D918_02267 [Trichuris suis]